MSPTNDRDAGFCSGGSENEEDLDHHHHQMRLISNCSDSRQSPIDAASEDSSLGGERFLLPAPAAAPKNKRKSSEPIRVLQEVASQSGPIKKRIKMEVSAAAEALKLKLSPPTGSPGAQPMLSPDPFRPWTSLIDQNSLSPAHAFKRHPGVTTLHRVPVPQFLSPVQDEPIALVAKKSPELEGQQQQQQKQKAIRSQKISVVPERHLLEEHHQQQQRPSRTPSQNSSTNGSFGNGTLNLSLKTTTTNTAVSEDGSSRTSRKEGASGQQQQQQQQQRNYKNMTRERRIEANARERTRVHTISAAFEKLRHSVPAYSNTQKLSKLSVLRIACAYIMSLSRVAGMDYSEDQSEPSVGECVDALTRTIQTEGKLRKKKDE